MIEVMNRDVVYRRVSGRTIHKAIEVVFTSGMSLKQISRESNIDITTLRSLSGLFKTGHTENMTYCCTYFTAVKVLIFAVGISVNPNHQ